MYNSSARNIGDATNKIQDIELYNDKNNVKY